MTKKVLYSVFLLLCSIYLPLAQAEEKITLSTFYPAPHGEYEYLAANSMVVGRTYPFPIEDNLIVEGNVGIGTASPSASLDIYKNANAVLLEVTNPTGSGTGTWMSDFLGGYINGLRVRSGNIYRTDQVFYAGDKDALGIGLAVISNNSVGIGTTSPGAELDVNGDIHVRGSLFHETSGNALIINHDGAGRDWLRLAEGSLGTDSGYSWRGWIQSNNNLEFDNEAAGGDFVITGGNVGIGTVSPFGFLNVYQNTDNTGTSNLYLEQDGAGDPTLKWGLTGGATYTMGIDNTDDYFKLGYHATSRSEAVQTGNLLTITTGGNVGIGTTSPGNKLVVKGGIEVADTNTHDGIKFPNAETNTVPDEETWLMWDNSEGFMFYFNGSWRTIEDNYNPSDERLKQNITGLGSTTDVLSLYERISPVKFQWNETMNELDPVDMEEEHVGLIAQDIEDYFPQWISEGSAGYKVIDDKGEIQYYNMQAIKELDSRTSFIESTYNASDALLVVNDNGNVGIGTASPSYKLDVNGSFRATSKSFDIPYPPDPENKRLVHGCIEGPELAVYYRGEAKLSNGEALIELPEYFETLTRKGARTVQLTAKGAQPYLLSSTGISEGRFRVYGTKPDGEFYWEVKAVRADIEPLKAVVEREEGN